MSLLEDELVQGGEQMDMKKIVIGETEPESPNGFASAAPVKSEYMEEELRPKQKGGPLSCVKRVIFRLFPPGGILSSAFNLASGSLGAGILGLPAASDTAGLGMAVIYLVIITFFSVFSMHILAIVAQKTNIRSFEGVARALFPQSKCAFSYWVAFIRWFHAFGGCVGYIISVGNCLSPIFDEAYRRQPDNQAIKFFQTTSGLRLLQALIWLCIMLPLVLPKHIDTLRYASMFAVSFMTYFVIIIVVHSCIHGLPEHRDNVLLSGNHNDDKPGSWIFMFRTGNPALSALGVFMFAYVCQINAYEVLWDMRPEIRTTRNYTYAALIGMLICGSLYLFVCVFGYFDFGSEKLASNSILLMYNPLSEPEVMLAYVGVLVKLCVSYALLSIASRNAIYYMMGWQQRYRVPRRHRRFAKAQAENSAASETYEIPELDRIVASNDEAEAIKETDACLNPDSVTDPDTQFVDNIPYWQHLIVVVILAVVKLICGLFIPNINIVFGFAGAISGGFLAFIFPALFYMYSGEFSVRKAGWFNYIFTYLLLLCGVTGVIFGTGATIYSTANGE